MKKTIIILLTMLMLAASGVFCYASGGSVTISKYTAPKKIKAGSSFVIKGKIKSAKTIRRVEAGIVNSKGKWTKYKYDNKKVNSKAFNLARADRKLRFGKLRKGTYKYRVYVHTADGKVHVVLNRKFRVVSAKKVKKTKVRKAEQPAARENKTVSGEKVSDDDNGVKLKGVALPPDYYAGDSFDVSGTLTSEEIIKKVEIGIVFAPTNKWTVYKHIFRVNDTSFDIEEAAPFLSFSKLPGGTYWYRIYVHTDSGVTTALNHAFMVTPSNRPQMAVNWAVDIANDESFSYGKMPATCTPGCYFCGTNQKKKPKGYEKTYVCITFAGAAYAHGAGDPEILNECRRGRMTMYENNSNFTVFSCWMKIGSCADLSIEDLQPGDVIIKWDDHNTLGHACIYAGGDELVEASMPGWKANTIAVRGGAAKRLKSLAGNRKNYVMRYIH